MFCPLLVSFRLGEVLDPYTKLYMVIHGDKGDTDKIYLAPKGGKLEPGKMYTVTVQTTDVGSVSIWPRQPRWGLSLVASYCSKISWLLQVWKWFKHKDKRICRINERPLSLRDQLVKPLMTALLTLYVIIVTEYSVIRRPISSVGRSPVCRAGGRWLTNQQPGSVKKLVRSRWL